MTDIEQAARAEALVSFLATKGFNPHRMGNWDRSSGIGLADDAFNAGYDACASWLAEYLLSDDNVEKAARAAYDEADQRKEKPRWDALGPKMRGYWSDIARAALQAVLGKDAS